MMTSYKAGVLRPELIRLRGVLSKGTKTAYEVIEVKEKRKKRWWESSVEKEDLPSMDSFNFLSSVLDKKLEAMISMCDHAVEEQHALYLDSEDIMFINQLKSLEEMVKANG